MEKTNHKNAKIRVANSDDNMKSLTELYVIGGEKILPWVYGKHFENIYTDAVKVEYNLKSTYVYEIDKKIVGLISAYPNDYDKKVDQTEHIKTIKKHINVLDWFFFLNRCRKIKKYIKEPPNSYHVAIIAVYDEYRRKGIAKDLLSYAENIAKKQAYSSIFAEVQSDNILSIKTFEKQGYICKYEVPTSKLSKKYWDDKNLTVLFMEKKLTT